MKNKCKCIDVALIVNLRVNLSFQIVAKDAEKQQQQQDISSCTKMLLLKII